MYINVQNSCNKLWKLLNQIQALRNATRDCYRSRLIDSIGGDSKTTIYKGNEIISLKARVFQNHKEAFIYLENILKEYKVLSSFKNLDSVGHRVVHGGDKFISSAVVNDEVVEQIELTSKLAPLHNESKS